MPKGESGHAKEAAEVLLLKSKSEPTHFFVVEDSHTPKGRDIRKASVIQYEIG